MVTLDEKTLERIRHASALIIKVHSVSPEAVARISAFRESLAQDLHMVHAGKLKGRYNLELYAKVQAALGEKAKGVFDKDDHAEIAKALEELGYPTEANFDPKWIERAVEAGLSACILLVGAEETEKARKKVLSMWEKFHASKYAQEQLIRLPHLIAAYLLICAEAEIVQARTKWVSRYKNHCWKCSAAVDATFNPKCPACGWSICICGTCTSHGQESFWKHKGPPCPQPLKDWFQQNVAAAA